ncbi:MAG: VRR-NUC domain-containing protein [Elusimicrobia bacterium]|nr:VRR-NUC domain-containing protein [Elusimicrobiota bacterium]
MRDREHLEAVSFVHWWNLFAERFGVSNRLLWAIPNGGHRHPFVAAKMKAEGVQRGACDYVLFVPRQGYHGLAIELKVAKTGRVSPDQKSMIELLKEQGYVANVCFGWDEARLVVEGYLGAAR